MSASSWKGTKCICGSTNTDAFGVCSKYWELKYLSLKNTLLGKKAQRLLEAKKEKVIDINCYIIKRDRLLHLQKITRDKYLTKLKKEVENI